MDEIVLRGLTRKISTNADQDFGWIVQFCFARVLRGPWPSNSIIRIGRSPFCASLKIWDTFADLASGVGSPGLLVWAALKSDGNLPKHRINSDHFIARID